MTVGDEAMMELAIEWRHYEKEGATCDRCAATGTSVREVVSELRNELADKGVTVLLMETKLPEELMAQSNLILFNGVPIEELLVGAEASRNACESCSCLTGTETSCRTIAFAGDTHEEIPADLIRLAAYKAIGITTR